MEKRRIPKLIIVPGELTKNKIYSKDFIKCDDCNSNLVYIEVEFGIVKRELDYGIAGNKSNRVYSVEEIGFSLYCAECGSFVEDFQKFFHDDELVYSFRGTFIDEEDMITIKHCLHQFDQKRDFTPLYNFPELDTIKEKLIEFEKKYPEVNE
jgi:hypothetical protein